MADGMSSGSILSKAVYAQDTQPTDKRPGVLWVDTSVSPPNTFAYDEEGGAWEPVATKNVYVQNSEPSGPTTGEIWSDTSSDPPTVFVYDGSEWVDLTPPKVLATGKLNVGSVGDNDALTEATRGKTGEKRLYNLSTSTVLGELTAKTTSQKAYLEATTGYDTNDYYYQFTVLSN